MGQNGVHDVPKSGILVFRKNVFVFSGDATMQKSRETMSQNRGFLFPEKRFSHFWDMAQKIGCPFLGISYF